MISYHDMRLDLLTIVLRCSGGQLAGNNSGLALAIAMNAYTDGDIHELIDHI